MSAAKHCLYEEIRSWQEGCRVVREQLWQQKMHVYNSPERAVREGPRVPSEIDLEGRGPDSVVEPRKGAVNENDVAAEGLKE